MKNNGDNKRLNAALSAALIVIDKNKIGLLKEHTLHRVLKFYYSTDETNHEIKIGSMYADVLKDNHIYEIQTKNFNLMKDKLNVFLKDYKVTICFPIVENKVIHLFDEDNVCVKKSPKHGRSLEICLEMYKIKSFLNNINLSFDVLMMDVDEYRIKVPVSNKRRKGVERFDQVPKNINYIYSFNSHNDWKDYLIELNMPKEFTSYDLSKITHIVKNKCSTILNVLYSMNIVDRIGKNKNSYLYKIV